MRVSLMVMLLVAAAPAWAEWVRIARSDAAVHYVDPATVQVEGNLRRVWALQDMADAGDDGVMSIRALQEHDCSDGRFRYLSVAAHSAPMAGGQVLAAHELRDRWSAPLRNRSAIGKIVCAP